MKKEVKLVLYPNLKILYADVQERRPKLKLKRIKVIPMYSIYNIYKDK